MKLILAYDGSSASERVLDFAVKRCRLLSARLVVVSSLVGGNETSSETIEEARQGLEHVERILEHEKIPHEAHLLIRGLTPGEDLVQFADEVAADEIILGIRKKSKVGKLLFGSTVQYTILHAPCAVVTIR